jgi:Bacterial regulatory proteins, tetR family
MADRMQPRALKRLPLPRRKVEAHRKTEPREGNGSDVITFTDSINRGFSSEIFGDERRNSIRKLIIAAIECFAEYGFHVTTTRDIAKRAGMSPCRALRALPHQERIAMQADRRHRLCDVARFETGGGERDGAARAIAGAGCHLRGATRACTPLYTLQRTSSELLTGAYGRSWSASTRR